MSSKVVRLRFRNGTRIGEYVVDDAHVWGRPTGIAVAHDGSLLASEDEAERCGRALIHPQATCELPE